MDRAAGVVRLRPELSKNYAGRGLPLSDPLREMLERRWKARSLKCLRAFHKDEQPIGDWRKTWTRSCVEAGLFRVLNQGAKNEHKVPTESGQKGIGHPA